MRKRRTLGKRRLFLEDVVERMDVTKATLLRYWKELVAAGLAFEEKIGHRISRTTHEDRLDAIWEKLFWLMLERQKPYQSSPPYMKSAAVQRIWQEIKPPGEFQAENVAFMGGIDVRRFHCWIVENKLPTVTMFERFCVGLGHDLWPLLDIREDVLFCNYDPELVKRSKPKPRKKEEK